MKKTKKNQLLYRMWKGRMGYLFILPIFILIAIFQIKPPINGLLYSFYEWDGVHEPIFVGLNNFKKLFSDEIFIESLPTMFLLSVPSLFIGIIANLFMAELLFNLRNKKKQSIYRILILLPMVAPGVVGTMLWKNMYNPQDGLFNEILRALHILEETEMINFLNDFNWIIPALIFMGFPWIGGATVLIYLSGLNALSEEVVEASRLDGCTTFKRVFLIDLPNLTGQLRYFLVFGLIGAFQSYGVQVVLTNGGPGNSTMVPGYYMYKQAFGYGNFGYAGAIGSFLFILIGIVTAITYKITAHKEDA